MIIEEDKEYLVKGDFISLLVDLYNAVRKTDRDENRIYYLLGCFQMKMYLDLPKVFKEVKNETK